MDNERIKGAAQKIKGTTEKTVGKLVGNRKLETDGKVDEATGDIRKAVGKAKDDVKDAVKKAST
jgi:uncharacterized protein YjbJ (UPF0337 family)